MVSDIYYEKDGTMYRCMSTDTSIVTRFEVADKDEVTSVLLTGMSYEVVTQKTSQCIPVGVGRRYIPGIELIFSDEDDLIVGIIVFFGNDVYISNGELYRYEEESN